MPEARSRRIRKRPCTFPLLILMIVMATGGEARIPQHRIKRAKRKVPYNNLAKKRNVGMGKFWIPDSHPKKRHLASGQANRTEFWFDSTSKSWHLHLDAKKVLAAEKPKRRTKKHRSRKLFGALVTMADEEVHQETIIGEGQNQTFNVSTEIEYGHRSNVTNATTESVVYSTSESAENSTDIASRPLRIRMIFSEHQRESRLMNQTQRTILFHDVLSPAILAWSVALRVNPVAGNLTVDASQLKDGVSCGPGLGSGHPSVVVPEEHFEEGIPADFVVYLSLAFAPGEPEEVAPGGTGTPSASPTTLAEKSNLVSHDQNEFDSIADMVGQDFDMADSNRYSDPNGDLYCAGDFLAASTYCSTDQWDRPTAALLHLCIGHDFFEPRSLARNVITVMHELGHSLGFNPQSMAHFRDAEGNPITPRDKDGNVPEQRIECSGPYESRRFANVTLPSSKIIQFRTVRGGVRVAEVVSPSVTQVAKNHFDCQWLFGAELESGNLMVGEDETIASCIGDHWERRLFRTDLMNSIVDEVPFSLRISPITLALFADSGWYQVDLSRTAYVDGWGRGAGCSFVTEECISHDGAVSVANEPFFCNRVATDILSRNLDQIQGCSPDMSSKAMCSMAQYEQELPSEYQYFNGTLGSNVGGNEPLIDYCPVYTGFSNGQCQESANRRFLTVSKGEEFGARNSRCVTGLVGGHQTGLCLPIACVVQDRSLRVRIQGVWKKCSFGGQELKIPPTNNHVVCPNPIRTCPTFFCNRDCLGTNGICDYETGTCLCASKINASHYVNCGDVNGELFGEWNDPLFYNMDSVTQESAITGSPLADYYYADESALPYKGRRRVVSAGVIAVICILVSALVLANAVMYERNKAYRERVHEFVARWRPSPSATNDDDDEEDEHFEPPPWRLPFRLNKDKFVASMLVDMRVHHPNDASEESESLPDTETDSSAQLSRSSRSDMDECSSRGGSEVPASDTPAAAAEEEEQVPASIIRRRFLGLGFRAGNAEFI